MYVTGMHVSHHSSENRPVILGSELMHFSGVVIIVTDVVPYR